MTESPSTSTLAFPQHEAASEALEAVCLRSAREPLLVFFLSASGWLLIGLLLQLIASLKFHQPALLSQFPALTYGRIQPAGINAILYGFALQAGVGVALYLFVRIGQATVSNPVLLAIAGLLLNFSVLVGVLGILAGDSTGFPGLQMPRYAQLMLLISYLTACVLLAMTFHARRKKPLAVSQWFALAGLFWFAWIHSTAILMLMRGPVRGVTQIVIAWWFDANFQLVWMGLIGVAAIFHFLPKLSLKTPSNSYLALFAFWILTLFGSCTGVPNSAPVPAWLPALSTVASVITFLAGLAVLVNVTSMISGWSRSLSASPMNFLTFAGAAFVISLGLNALRSLSQVAQVLDLTWFGPGVSQLQVLGFFLMAMFGSVYVIVFELLEVKPPQSHLGSAHFWLAAIGVLLIALPFLGAGIVQGLKLNDSHFSFLETWNAAKPLIRMTTTGFLALFLAALIFYGRLLNLAARFYRTHVEAAYVVANQRTAE